MEKHIMHEEAEKLAKEIRSCESWDADLLARLCAMAGLTDEWEAADGDTFETVAFKAAEILGVEII